MQVKQRSNRCESAPRHKISVRHSDTGVLRTHTIEEQWGMFQEQQGILWPAGSYPTLPLKLCKISTQRFWKDRTIKQMNTKMKSNCLLPLEPHCLTKMLPLELHAFESIAPSETKRCFSKASVHCKSLVPTMKVPPSLAGCTPSGARNLPMPASWMTTVVSC